MRACSYIVPFLYVHEDIKPHFLKLETVGEAPVLALNAIHALSYR